MGISGDAVSHISKESYGCCVAVWIYWVWALHRMIAEGEGRLRKRRNARCVTESLKQGSAMKINVSPRTIRRLTAAEGYLELNMPDHALEELEAVEDPGPLEAIVDLMKGEVLKSQERYEEAVIPLKRAAEMVPAPLNKKAWLSLSECFRRDGKDDLADMAEQLAQTEPSYILQMPLNIELRVTIASQVPDENPEGLLSGDEFDFHDDRGPFEDGDSRNN